MSAGAGWETHCASISMRAGSEQAMCVAGGGAEVAKSGHEDKWRAGALRWSAASGAGGGGGCGGSGVGETAEGGTGERITKEAMLLCCGPGSGGSGGTAGGELRMGADGGGR